MADQILKIQHLNKSFGKQHVLRDVSFQIPRGAILGLIGANGAGKSTIMKCIVGLLHFQSGSIQIDGRRVDFRHRKPLSQVGTMIEAPAIYKNLTGWDHLRLLNDGNSSKADLVRIAKATDIANFMHRKAKKYSLGMKQRLGIAMTLVNHPKLLILDEPMNALDPQSTYHLRNLLLKLSHRGVSILVSSHILSELAKVADYYVVINHGRVVAKAPAQQILNAKDDFLKIQTTDNQQALKLISQKLSSVKVAVKSQQIIVPNQARILNLILKVWVQNQIEIQSIHEANHNLENSVLKLLRKGDK